MIGAELEQLLRRLIREEIERALAETGRPVEVDERAADATLAAEVAAGARRKRAAR